MERRTKQAGAKRKSRKSLWISLAVVAIVIALLVMEQVAVLYVLATLSVVGLLVIVALADLGAARRPAGEAAVPPHDDAAAIADGVASPSTTFGSTTPRRTAKQR